MSEAIRKYPEGQREAVVARRLKGKTGGLGYLSAQDFVARKGEQAKRARKLAEEQKAEAEAEAEA